MLHIAKRIKPFEDNTTKVKLITPINPAIAIFRLIVRFTNALYNKNDTQHTSTQISIKDMILKNKRILINIDPIFTIEPILTPIVLNKDISRRCLNPVNSFLSIYKSS